MAEKLLKSSNFNNNSEITRSGNSVLRIISYIQYSILTIMPEYKVAISSSGWKDEEIHDLADVFSQTGIKASLRTSLELSAEPVDPVLIFAFTYGLSRLMDSCIGTIIGSTFKIVMDKVGVLIDSRHEKSKLQFQFKNANQQFNFEIQSCDSKTINLAIEKIGGFLDSHDHEQKFHYAFFNNDSSEWESTVDRKIEFCTTGIVAIADKEVYKDGKAYTLTKPQLQKLVDNFVPYNVNSEHSGPPIGIMSKIWLDGNILYSEASIFSDVDEDLKTKIKSGKLGFSLGLS